MKQGNSIKRSSNKMNRTFQTPFQHQPKSEKSPKTDLEKQIREEEGSIRTCSAFMKPLLVSIDTSSKVMDGFSGGIFFSIAFGSWDLQRIVSFLKTGDGEGNKRRRLFFLYVLQVVEVFCFVLFCFGGKGREVLVGE